MARYRCARPEKPRSCFDFPRKAGEIREFPSCSFYFEEGVRKGECSECGECCMRPYIHLPEFGRKFTEELCPWLEQVDGY